MVCNNPIIKGFYPDPSICYANGKFYLVNSTFEYFPGIPVFESSNLIDWKQVGNVLTRSSQLDLSGIAASGGIYAPTIRYNNGRFYVVVTNVSNDYGNFYVYTDDIYGQWSDPVRVNRGGIDPSLLFDGEETYFLSNGEDDDGVNGISLCKIDIQSGKQLGKAKCISQGCGGRYLEGPHLYHIGQWYYLMVAEGGTEYGHMECILRSKDIWGPYEPCPSNPILTNRNLGGYYIQGAGHADLVQDAEGNWFMVHLAFRQIGQFEPFHNLGRETFLMPVYWKDEWPQVGADGTCCGSWETNGTSCKKLTESPEQTYSWKLEEKGALYLRLPDFSNYKVDWEKGTAELAGTKYPLGSTGCVTFLGQRQKEFEGCMKVSVDTSSMNPGDEAGIAAYLTEKDYYYVSICKLNGDGLCQVKANPVIDGRTVPGKTLELKQNSICLAIQSNHKSYSLMAMDSHEKWQELNSGHVKFLTSEVACGFTGVVLALFAQSNSSKKTGNIKFTVK